MINEQIDPPAAAFEILVETHDLDLDRLPYNTLTAAAATNLSVSLTCNSPIVVYIFYKCSTVKEKRCVNCFDHCFGFRFYYGDICFGFRLSYGDKSVSPLVVGTQSIYPGLWGQSR